MSSQDENKKTINDKRSNQYIEPQIDYWKTTENQAVETKKSVAREWLETIVYIVIVFSMLFLLRQYIAVPVSIDGPSMAPTLAHGDRLIQNKLADQDRFDIVVFPAPDGSDAQYIKRIIGIPGDRIAYIEGVLYVNDQPIIEPYLEKIKAENSDWEAYLPDFNLEEITGEAIVPEGYYFVLGDNRLNSKDSRSFGYIPNEEVSGVANFRFWPISDFGNANTMLEENEKITSVEEVE